MPSAPSSKEKNITDFPSETRNEHTWSRNEVFPAPRSAKIKYKND
jgi:hypothetical protein